jgi:N-methylhydantoinase A
VHATTLTTNAIIEQKGARTALVTTRGFADTLEIGRELRYDLYDLELRRPDPVVPANLRFEITERVDAAGAVLTRLDDSDLAAVANELRRRDVQAVAISLLHSYVNPDHERRIAASLCRALPGVALSVSSDVCPDVREYERTTTTVLNAYVQPLTARYLDDLCRRLAAEGFAGTPYIMLSSGGVTTIAAAVRHPIRLIESGPAAGALAAAYFSTDAGVRDVIAFDMGGTTAKICVVRDGRPQVANQFEAARVHRFKKGSGYPVKVPAVDLIEIGAGGGSIAWIDAMGLLKVGPASAGAQPGPACYGQGGGRPCVTDADLMLGYFDPDGFLGGRMRLSRERAEAALQTLAAPLGLDAARAAWGIREVVNENMARAAQVYTAEQGLDSSGFTLLAFGGAGPAHAWDVARKVGIRQILCPLGSGIASAIGLLVAPKRCDMVRAFVTPLDRADFARISSIFDELEAEAARTLGDAGTAAGEMSMVRTAEMRYRGQGYEITVPIPPGDLRERGYETLTRAFEDTYRQVYGRIISGAPVEVINWRVTALERARSVARPRTAASVRTAPVRRRPVYWHDAYVDTPVYSRYGLQSGFTAAGPALIEEDETTTAVGPGGMVTVDASLNLVITCSPAVDA